jgi:hypothetical protein
MASNDSKNRIDQFEEPDQISGSIFFTWLKRSGVERRTIIEEIKILDPNVGDIGDKSFKQWTSEGESAKRVSGITPELRGDRVVAMVRWFIQEHTHRSRPVITNTEMRKLMSIYIDLPIKHRLKLKRLIHDLEIQTGEREANFSFAKDWKSHFADWPVFCFVLDPYWTIRASTCYEMALACYKEEDMMQAGWWHRLTASRQGKAKYLPDSPRYSLRGPYADVYYYQQLKRFRVATEHLQQAGDKRYGLLMNLLRSSQGFEDRWARSFCPPELAASDSMGIPVPFFRQDDTLLWMLEVSTTIPHTPNYQLIVWVPLNEDSAEYQAEIRRWADEPGRFSRKAFFIEDFAHYFNKEERLALDV